MYNLIEDSEKKWIQQLNIFPNEKYNYELEIRFNNITKEIYENILNHFNTNYKELKIIHYTKNEKILYNNNLSKIYDNDSNVCKVKRRLKWKQLINIPGSINLSTESNIIENLTFDKIVYIKRYKERTSFIDKINNISYDFTIIDKMKYQIEIEVLEIYSNFNIVHVNIINDSICKIINYLPLNVKKILKQPSTLKDKEIILKNYAVTEKLDGIRTLLYIDNKNNVILIKNNFQQRIVTNLKVNDFCNTIIDGEYIEDTKKYFYAFDIILYKGNFLNDNLINRNKKLNDIKFSSKKGKMEIYYRVKKYYYKDILKHSNLILKKKHKFQIDGLIFNTINNYYRESTIYKWKFTITFDFMIKKNNHEKKILWELYCYDRNNKYILFPINEKNIISVLPDTDKLYPDRSIIEFYFDNKFIPMKIRNDKILPNFIDIALDNWNCLFDKIIF